MYYNILWKIKGEKEINKGAIDLNTPLLHVVEKVFKEENPFDIEIVEISLE